MSSDVALRTSGLGKRYDIFDSPGARLRSHFAAPFRRMLGRPNPAGGRPFWALKDVSFDVARGESIGILGRNGSGKSTLLQIICGTLRATTGHVASHGRIGALLELGAGFNGNFTGRENVRLNAMIMGLSRREIDERMEEILAFAEIGDFIDQPVRIYSSGMFVRLAFAVQACLRPDILVIDEALAVGDEKFQRKCYAFMDSLKERGTAVVLVTHSTATVEKYCDRALLLHQGTMHGLGPTSAIVNQYHALLFADEKTYLRLLNATEQKSTRENSPSAVSEPEAQSSQAPAASAPEPDPDAGVQRARISQWALLDCDGASREYFRPGEQATLRFTVECRDTIAEMQAGVAIRTVEGVLAYGTSTDYYGQNMMDARIGQSFDFCFEIALFLCAGTYFISFSVAEKLGQGDMAYLDKKVDQIVLRVQEPDHRISGIAYLETRMRQYRHQ